MLLAKLCGCPTDIYSATYSIFIINRLLGTAPFGLQKPPGRGYQMAIGPMVGSSLKVAAIIVGIMVNVMWGERMVSFKFHVLMNVYFGFLSITFIVCACFRAGLIIDAFKLIDDIDEKLKSLGIWMDYRNVKKNINTHLLLMAGFGFIMTVLLLELNSLETWFTTSFFIGGIPQVLIFIVEFQYFHYLRIAMDRYKILNEYLEALTKEKETFFESASANESTSLRPQKLSAGLLKSTRKTCDPYFVLQTISELHIQLTDMCGFFERAFSVQLLVRIAVSFVTITISLFYFFVDLGIEFSYIRDNVQLLSVVFVLIALICIVELFLLAWISDSTCKEANSCPLFLHKLKHKCKGAVLQEIIQLYSVQMYHNKLQFTVCGLFPLDHSLLYSMTGAVTTYLIFLVQFSKMSDMRAAFSDSSMPNMTAPPE